MLHLGKEMEEGFMSLTHIVYQCSKNCVQVDVKTSRATFVSRQKGRSVVLAKAEMILHEVQGIGHCVRTQLAGDRKGTYVRRYCGIEISLYLLR